MSILLLVSLTLSGAGAAPVRAEGITSDQIDVEAARAERALKSCGPVAVCYCLRRSGRDVRLRDVLDRARMTDDGTSIPDVLDLLSAFGLPGKVLAGDKADFESLPAPAILLVGPSHCIVFEGLTDGGRSVRYFEPSYGSLKTLPREIVSRDWTGEAIVFREPGLSWAGLLGWAALGAVSVVMVALGVGLRRPRQKPDPARAEASP